MDKEEAAGGEPQTAFLEAAMLLAAQAGHMLREAEGQRRTIDYKGKINLVTEMDRKVEQFLGSELLRRFPDHDFLAEEDQKNVSTGAEYRWIVDPLDGTTNYAHGLPIYSVSIALAHRDTVIVGAVYQPVTDEMFTATRGGGARLNGAPIQVSLESELVNSLLVTGFPYDMHETDRDNLDHFGRFMKEARAVRRLGSAALDLCYVARGRFDGFWELKLAPWDMAAGGLIAAEAGAKLTSISGGAWDPFCETIIASNGKIHEAMEEVLRRS
jgi:myo-inositol-1(or 4)-monophosphatase